MFSSRILRFVPIFFIFFFAGCVTQNENLKLEDVEKIGKVIALKTNKIITVDELISRLSVQPFILIGEEHDQYIHHQLEEYLLRQLEKSKRSYAVAFEMLNVAQQAAIDGIQEKLRQGQSFTDTEIKAQAAWKRWDWAMYRNLLIGQLSLASKVIATNLTLEEIGIIFTGAEPLKGDKSTTNEVREKIAQLMAAVNHVVPIRLDQMVTVQQFRDRRMAEKLVKSSIKPTALIAGNHHVRKDIGVPIHLADYGVNQGVAVLMLKTQQENISYTQADYLWLTN